MIHSFKKEDLDKASNFFSFLGFSLEEIPNFF